MRDRSLGSPAEGKSLAWERGTKKLGFSPLPATPLLGGSGQDAFHGGLTSPSLRGKMNGGQKMFSKVLRC